MVIIDKREREISVLNMWPLPHFWTSHQWAEHSLSWQHINSLCFLINGRLKTLKQFLIQSMVYFKTKPHLSCCFPGVTADFLLGVFPVRCLPGVILGVLQLLLVPGVTGFLLGVFARLGVRQFFPGVLAVKVCDFTGEDTPFKKNISDT